jgi:hypothetical protein
MKLDINTDLHRLELVLESAPGQISMQAIRLIPTPSQVDDWCLYERIEGDKIKALHGEASYLEWRLLRREAKLERDEWKRTRLSSAEN